MTLPPNFSNPEDYIQRCVAFFCDNHFLFTCANTDILVENVLDNINIENLNNIDVFESNFDLRSVENCMFLKKFFSELDELSPVFAFEDVHIETDVDVPLSQKKRHEIMYLAKHIEELCKGVDCNTVVDLGSGLGYLDQLLFKTTNFKVLGLECNDSHYTACKTRQRKYHAESIDNVKYVRHFITEDTHIENYVDDKFGNNESFCITGLHACADLAVTAMHLFLGTEAAKAMILMPCCYHRIKQIDRGNFQNFPLSGLLQNAYENCGTDFINVPFLRLAAHPPQSINDNFEDLVFNLLARAILQLYANKHNCKIKRNKRKAVKTKTVNKDFTEYVKNARSGFTLCNLEEISESVEHGKDSKFEIDELELDTMWREITDFARKKVCIFLMLQNYVQPVIENFVLYDRLIYLNERGISKCSYKKIFEENISPRCLALVTLK